MAAPSLCDDGAQLWVFLYGLSHVAQTQGRDSALHLGKASFHFRPQSRVRKGVQECLGLRSWQTSLASPH